MLVKYDILLSPVKHRICANTDRMEIWYEIESGKSNTFEPTTNESHSRTIG